MKRQQAAICSRTNRVKEAYQLYEELLFTSYQMLNMVFNSIYMLAMEEGDMKKAHVLVDKQKQLANVGELCAFSKSPLYEHMVFKDVQQDFLAEVDEICGKNSGMRIRSAF